ncbi:MAG: hypothetical protein AAGA66_02610 [Bacteroidota bacterium]
MMYTLKSFLLIAIMALCFSCQENDEELVTIEDEESVVAVCSRANCAARVTVVSQQFIRWQILNRAINQIRQRPSFNSIINQNRPTWRVVRQNGNTYAVFIPYAGSQLLF